MSELYVGPAGWSYEDWKGRVYPEPAPRNFDPLAYLARSFNAIEVNSSFYRPPSARMAASWARRVPDAFRFTVKAWQRFTHDREAFSGADVLLFREGLAPLAASGKLAAVLLQFPWFFRMSGDNRDRLRRAAEALADVGAPLVVELRHRSWLEAFDLLRALKLSFCNIDQPPSAGALTGTRYVTGPIGYARLHGRNAKAWFDPRAGRDAKYDYLYSAEELKPWIEAVAEMGEADSVFVITNNHFQGKAVANALQLAKALGKELEIPAPLRAAYPELFP
ncbi:MAG TPA: DUF72 domain-containing protein [Planctomycetota bacterium]